MEINRVNNRIGFGNSLIIKTKNDWVYYKSFAYANKEDRNISFNFGFPLGQPFDGDGYFRITVIDGAEETISKTFGQQLEDLIFNRDISEIDKKRPMEFLANSHCDFIVSCAKEAQKVGNEITINTQEDAKKLIKLDTIEKIIETFKK